MRKFYQNKELILEVSEDFPPFAKMKLSSRNSMTEEELKQFMDNCGKYMLKLAKKYPNLEFEDLADIDQLTDIAAVKEHLTRRMELK